MSVKLLSTADSGHFTATSVFLRLILAIFSKEYFECSSYYCCFVEYRSIIAKMVLSVECCQMVWVELSGIRLGDFMMDCLIHNYINQNYLRVCEDEPFAALLNGFY